MTKWQSKPSYTPCDGGESTSIAPPSLSHHDTSSAIATQPWRSNAKLRIVRRLHIYAKRKWGMSKELSRSGPSYTPCDGGESTSIAPPLPHHDTSSTIATQPWRSNAKLHIIRRLHIYAKRKWGMSKELSRPGPSYTPYDGAESTSIAPPSPHEATSLTTATQP